MTEEKWKSPTGHPISSSETDGLKQCPEGLECSGDGSDCVGEYRCVKEPETVSSDDLMTSVSQCDSANYCYGWNDAIDHLRAQYPNGIKWRE